MAISLVKPFDPREQDVLIRHGEGDVDPSPPPAAADLERLRRLDGCEAVMILVDRFGADTVIWWARGHGLKAGQVVSEDRPSHLCLADGAALQNNRCVQCGRDNS